MQHHSPRKQQNSVQHHFIDIVTILESIVLPEQQVIAVQTSLIYLSPTVNSRMHSQPFFLLFLLLAAVPLLTVARALPAGKGHTVAHSNKEHQKRMRSSSRTSRLPITASSPKKAPIAQFLKKVQERGYNAYQEAVARGSSTFESACIKATRPNDDPAKEKYVSAIVAAVSDFEEPKKQKQKTKTSVPFDPYQVIIISLLLF